MPPVRRASGGWLLRRISRGDDYSGDLVGGDHGRSLPDDALSPVLACLPTAADVVRCAAACRRWASVVAKDAAVLSRTLAPPLQGLTLGFFHQPDGATGATPRKRKRLSSNDDSDTAAQPRFFPSAAAAGLLGLRSPSKTALADAVLDDQGRSSRLLEHARPVASRNGCLVVELRRERHTEGLTLCVVNPMTGDLAQVPPLSGSDKPGDYACALYTGHDDLVSPPLSSFFFRVLIVYNRRSSTVLRSYSSDTRSWSAEVNRSWGPKVSSEDLRALGQSIVLRGVAYWPLRRTVLAVRIDTPEPAELRMPLSGTSSLPLGWRSLGVTPDGRLTFIDAAVCGGEYVTVAARAFLCPKAGEDDDGGGKWETIRGNCIRMTQLKLRCRDRDTPYEETIKLRWFCEKSGNLFFTLGKGTRSPGAFTVNMSTEQVEKVADDVDGLLHSHRGSWPSFVGYEMDGPTYLAAVLSGPLHSSNLSTNFRV
ncbi:hypothetical protein U9M48_041786 [Paspalum notatum var. saurae]|uniref:F-box domain-containing protein n=1 Tax=Paspalum notatum var. saurae TaxID=547442 RepID=A0AAQ3UPS6_PASNO